MLRLRFAASRLRLRSAAPALLGVLLLSLAISAAPVAGQASGPGTPEANPLPVPGDWRLHGRTSSEQRFSPLAQVGEQNVAQLGLAWSYETGSTRGLEATPLVADGVLYATSTWSVVFALDAKTGRELWRFDPQVPKTKGRHACCDVVNRGVALWQGRVYVGTIDGRLIALDAKSGAVVWQVQTTDPKKPYTITGAPRVLKGLVVIGNGGGEFGVRGYVSAYDASTGALRWRFYTVPASAGGPHEHPEVAVAAKTWSRDSLWEAGLGGTVWDSLAYDPELDLLYVGVGNSTPYNRDVRSPGGGDNLFLASILALRPDSGKLVWHYQTTPKENWDYTATQHMILADLEIAGRTRKVLMQAPKNGFFYVLDRETGELLSADPYVTISWATHVDLSTGRPVEREEAQWQQRGVAMVTPGPMGGHNWHPMAFSPVTRLVYIPSQETPYPYHVDPEWRFEPLGARFNTGEDFAALGEMLDGFEKSLNPCRRTQLLAWDPVARRRVWRVDRVTWVNGGVLATAGSLVFQGSGNGRFVAYQAATGRELWAADVGVGIMAPPITYQIDGEQYVAVLAGVGGSAGLNFERLDDANRGLLLAWKLGGTLPLPTVEVRAAPRRAVRSAALPQALLAASRDAETVRRGAALYNTHCFRCHGLGTTSGGVLPDLRESTAEVHTQWDAIVRGGIRGGRGMASFAEVLTREDSDAVQAYVLSKALNRPSFVTRAGQWAADRICLPAAWMAD